MTEAEWLDLDDPYPRQLAIIHDVASVRKLRLLAAVYVRGTQSRPEHAERKACHDLIEIIADQPQLRAEIEQAVAARPGLWGLTHTLFHEDAVHVAREVRQLVSMYGSDAAPTVRDLIRLIHEILGNPFRPVTFASDWRSDTALSLAKHIYESRDFAQMPVLADALQDAGCDNADILSHCHDPQQVHVRGCWVVDLVLGKE